MTCGRGIAVVHLRQQSACERPVGKRDQFTRAAEFPAPDPIAFRIMMLAERYPGETHPAIAVASGFGGIEAPAVKTVELAAFPWPCRRFCDPIDSLHSLGIAAFNQIPPVSQPEEFGTFRTMRQHGGGQRLAYLPVFQIVGSGDRHASPAELRPVLQARRDQHLEASGRLVAIHERIAPIDSFIPSWIRRNQRVRAGFRPRSQIGRGRLANGLRRGGLAIVAGVEEMEHALMFDDRTGPDPVAVAFAVLAGAESVGHDLPSHQIVRTQIGSRDAGALHVLPGSDGRLGKEQMPFAVMVERHGVACGGASFGSVAEEPHKRTSSELPAGRPRPGRPGPRAQSLLIARNLPSFSRNCR